MVLGFLFRNFCIELLHVGYNFHAGYKIEIFIFILRFHKTGELASSILAKVLNLEQLRLFLTISW